MTPGPRIRPRPPFCRSLLAAVALIVLPTPGIFPTASAQPVTPAQTPPRKANHDEARVPLYTLPDPLRMEDGSPVTSPEDWSQRRRPELLRLFETHVYGVFPAPPATHRWRVTSENRNALDGLAHRRDLVLELPDPTAAPADPSSWSPALRFTVFTPARSRQRVPVFVGVHLFDTARPDPAPAVPRDPGTEDRRIQTGLEVARNLLNRGYAIASLDIADLAPDNPTQWRQGALRLLPPSPDRPAAAGAAPTETAASDATGTIGVWAWGLCRTLDYFETTPDIDASAVLAIGHSRMGKAALWAAANDIRFAAVIANGSGCGGAALSKRDFGETVAIITHAFPHWFCPRFATYAGHEQNLPVDQHQLLALIAPRPLHLGAADQDLWADPRGEWLAAIHASPVFQRLGVPGFPPQAMPAPDSTLGQDLRFHLRRGRHDLTEVDWTHYLAFADQTVVPKTRAREITAAPRLNTSQALRLPDAWFASPVAASLASNILSHQTPAGDWPKNLNTAAKAFSGDPARLRGTFDNGATLAEIRFLARFHSVTASPAARDAARRGIEQILAAQYPSGGWPQSHPPGPGYARHITFNDGVMTGLLGLLVEIDDHPDFAFLDAPIRARARQAVAQGIDCILRCQVVARGTLTVWGAQHDALTFEPRPARTFEPASLAAAESAGVLSFLMRLPQPTPAITRAIRAGRAWFDRAALPDLRLVRTPDDVRVIPTPGAPPLWARFYDLDQNTPIFCGRDGVIRTRLEDIEQERRKGYAWYGNWGDNVAREFDRWARQHPE